MLVYMRKRKSETDAKSTPFFHCILFLCHEAFDKNGPLLSICIVYHNSNLLLSRMLLNSCPALTWFQYLRQLFGVFAFRFYLYGTITSPSVAFYNVFVQRKNPGTSRRLALAVAMLAMSLGSLMCFAT